LPELKQFLLFEITAKYIIIKKKLNYAKKTNNRPYLRFRNF